jgi:hypothetical protein
MAGRPLRASATRPYHLVAFSDIIETDIIEK